MLVKNVFVAFQEGGSELTGCVELTPCPSGLVLNSPGIATSTEFLIIAPEWYVLKRLPYLEQVY